MTRVTRDEWRWAIVAAALVMALTTIPYGIGFYRSDADWHFSGFVFDLNDGNSYIAKMARGARGEWLFRLFYTTEPHQSAIIFEFHILLGKLATLLSRPADPIALHDRLVAWYHGARIICGLALLLISYRFCAEFLRLPSQRRLAFILVALGGGLGWLLALTGIGGLPIDLYSPEAFTFLNLYGLPHLSAARALLLLGMLAYLRRRGVIAGFFWLLLGFVQPLYVLVGWAVLGADVAGQRLRRAPWRPAGMSAAIAGLISSPMVLYTAYIFRADPILAQWQRQNIILSPNPAHYLAGWGLLIAPAAIVMRRCLTRSDPQSTKRVFLVTWLAVVPFLLYVPYNLQRRFAEGAQLPLVCLAVVGLTVVLARWFRRHARRRIAIGVTLLSLPSTLILLIGGMTVAASPGQPVYIPAEKIAVFRWLGQRIEPDTPVLASFDIGNALPAYAPLVVYLGHGPETAYSERKQAEVEAFYRPETDDATRQALLAAGRIRYVVFERPTPSTTSFDPAAASYLRSQFKAGDMAVYLVVP